MQTAHLFDDTQRDPRAAQRFETVLSFREMGIEYRTVGQFVGGLMMIGYQHLEPEFVLRVFDFGDRSDAAIHAYYYACVGIFRDLLERADRYPVAVGVSVRNKIRNSRAPRPQIQIQYRRRADSVTIVIPVDDYPFVVRDRRLQSVRYLGKSVISVRRRQRVERRVQKRARGGLVVKASFAKQLRNERIYIQFIRQLPCVHISFPISFRIVSYVIIGCAPPSDDAGIKT